jgi:A/G-specific adenine glycosylase
VLDRLWELSEACTPHERFAAYNQAMMDLGATLCTRSAPACAHCPLADRCLALNQGNPTAYPEPKPRTTIPVRQTRLLAVRNPAGEILLSRRPPSGVWGGLWSLPECAPGTTPEEWCRERFGTAPRRVEKLSPRRHTFTHFHLDIIPLSVQLAEPESVVADDGGQLWYNPQRPAPVGLAAPVSRILDEIAAAGAPETGETP